MGRFLDRQRAHRKRVADRKDRLSEARDNAREQRAKAKISKRNAKKLSKIYGDLNPEEVNELNKIQPYTGAMNEELQAQGVEVENPDDVVEVSAKYNAQILGNEDIPTEDYEHAFLKDVSCYESVEEMDAQKRKSKRNVFDTVLNVVGGAIKGGIQSAKDKQRAGEPLTKADRSLLDLNDAANRQGKQAATGYLQKLALPALIALALYLVLKKSA